MTAKALLLAAAFAGITATNKVVVLGQQQHRRLIDEIQSGAAEVLPLVHNRLGQ